MGRRDKIESMAGLFRNIFEVRSDGRVVYRCAYKVTWACASGAREKLHYAGECFGTSRASGGHWSAGLHGVCGIKEHEVSWLLFNDGLPKRPLAIDHIDGNVDNNAPANLRAVTASVNQHNQRRAKGYSWSKAAGKWNARIFLNGCLTNLGLYDTELDARAAYIRAKRHYHPDCGWSIFQAKD